MRHAIPIVIRSKKNGGLAYRELEAAVILPDDKWGEIPICHSAATSATGAMIRLAQTEVQPGALQAARSAPEFADSDPPLWEGLGYSCIGRPSALSNPRFPMRYTTRLQTL
jgi:hypothetical protein